MPSLAQRGMTSSSGSRHSIEYWGWLETNRSTSGIARAALIWSGVHSLNPMYRALPWRTTSLSASIVSSSGVCLS